MDNRITAARRARLYEQLGNQGAALLFSASEVLRNGDVHYPFRQRSDFYYLTGFEEPDAVALFLPGSETGPFILFSRAPDPAKAQWEGPCVGQIGARDIYGADQAFDIKTLDEKLSDLLADRQHLYYPLSQQSGWDQKILHWCRKQQSMSPKSASPITISPISTIIDEMRLIKSPEEIDIMRKAAKISAAAHIKIMQACRPDIDEYVLAAIFDYEILRQGCRSFAYPTIVGGGANACILHYVNNNARLKAGDLVLVDAGAEYLNYAADITRSFPVNGKFTESQATLYQVVLQAQEAVIQAIRPGVTWHHLQDIADRLLADGLIALGILAGSLEEVLETKAYQQYTIHRVGHWLGLDVHDVGAYKCGDTWRPLESGMVLTVEPGIYLPASEHLDKKWWGIGIRIEDDVLVTPTGFEVLSSDVPKTIAEIEALMS